MPMTHVTLARAKKMALGWIEKTGAVGIEVQRIPRHVSSSLSRDGLIVRRENMWIAAQHQ